MRRQLTVIIILLVLSCTFIQGHAQSSSEIVIDAGSIPEAQPTRMRKTLLSDQEHIADMARTKSGAIYILLVNLTAPTSYSLVKFEEGEFSSRLMSFDKVLGGIEILGDSLFYVGDVHISENQSWYLIVELDLSGNRLSELNVTVQNSVISGRLYAGKDGMLYIWGFDFISYYTKMVKINLDGNVVWNKVIDTDMSNLGDIHVLPNGQVYILKDSGLELRDSNGESLWNRTLSSNINWIPKTLCTFDDNSVCALASYATGWIITGGTIYRYDIKGNLLGNKTFVVSKMEEDENVFIGDLKVYGNSIHSVAYYSSNSYLLGISKDFTVVNRHSIDRGGSIQFTEDGSIVLFSENRTRHERYLVAYVFSSNQTGMILIVGGAIVGILVLALIWRRKQI